MFQRDRSAGARRTRTKGRRKKHAAGLRSGLRCDVIRCAPPVPPGKPARTATEGKGKAWADAGVCAGRPQHSDPPRRRTSPAPPRTSRAGERLYQRAKINEMDQNATHKPRLAPPSPGNQLLAHGSVKNNKFRFHGKSIRPAKARATTPVKRWRAPRRR